MTRKLTPAEACRLADDIMRRAEEGRAEAAELEAGAMDNSAENQIQRASERLTLFFQVVTAVFLVASVAVMWCTNSGIYLFAADTRPVEPVSAAPYLTVSGVPTLAPAKQTAADKTLQERCDGWAIWNTKTVDGDTWDAECEKPFGQGWKICTDGQKRFRGDWDAYESSRDRRFDGKSASDEELVKGKKAADAFDSMMSKAARKFVLFVGDGSFSRDKVRLFWVQESGEVIEAGPWMVKHGHDRTRDENGKPR